MKTIILTGGGTAGHVMPNVAILPFLQDHKIIYIGSNGIESEIISKYQQVEFHQIECAKLRRSLTPKNLLIPFRVIKGIRQARKIIKQVQPSVVFSKGGFVSYPVVRAAKKYKIPIILHESDMTMGLANKLSVKRCSQVLTTFFDTAKEIQAKYKKAKVMHTGSPLRQEIYIGNAESIGSSDRKKMLVIGGSLGAKKINDTLREIIPKIDGWEIIHITGKGKMTESTKYDYYKQLEFVDNIYDYFAWADIVISRAGSNSLCELLALKKPMLLIPLSSGRGDQIQNAKYVSSKNAAAVLWEDVLNAETLAKGVNQVWERRDELVRNCVSYFSGIDGTQKVIQQINLHI